MSIRLALYAARSNKCLLELLIAIPYIDDWAFSRVDGDQLRSIQ